jgi:predicted PhzF superfamily epimerase YddE/YHI9
MYGTYEFVQVDVFTRTPFTGDALAIPADARGVTSLRRDYGLASGASLASAYFN